MSAVVSDIGGIFVTETGQRSASVSGTFLTEKTGNFVDLSGSIAVGTTLGGDSQMIWGLAGDIAPGISLAGELTFDVRMSGNVIPTITLSGDLSIDTPGFVDVGGGIVSSFILSGDLSIIPFVPTSAGNAAALMIGV